MSIISCTKPVSVLSCNSHWSQTRDNNSVDYRENINFMYAHFSLMGDTEHEPRIQIQNGSKQ